MNNKENNQNDIYYNNFINNLWAHAYDECFNVYDNATKGNYWDDYTGSDLNGDGIGDSHYLIPGGSNRDTRPVMAPFT